MTRQHHRWTIDAIEEGVARLEVDGERMVTLPAWILPADAAEGEVLRVGHDRTGDRSRLTITRDEDATRQAREASERQLAEMPPSESAGDVIL
jgi:hypothetical protein